MIHSNDLQGHWVRRWIKAPGCADHDTRVHWMQAGRDYSDVRIPLDRPDLSQASCLADLPAKALLSLARAEGFAGRISLNGDECTWHHRVNWHGPPITPDVGKISFDGKGRMIEAGVLAEYTELWEQKATTAPKARHFSGDGYTGVLVSSGPIGVLAIGQSGKPSSEPIIEALKGNTIPNGISAFFDGLHALCDVTESDAVARIATQPFTEGSRVLTFRDDRLTWHKTGFDGVPEDITLFPQTVSA